MKLSRGNLSIEQSSAKSRPLSLAPCRLPATNQTACPPRTTDHGQLSRIRPNSPSFRPAFSLVELLIVIVLMSILAKMAITSATPSVREQLVATANILSGELAYARSMAVGNNSSYRFDIDLTGNQLVMRHTGADTTLNTLPNSPFRSPSDPADQYSIKLTNLPRLAMPVNLLGAQAIGTTTQTITSIEFGPYGATTQSNQSVLWLTAGLGNGRRFISIGVNPVTGLATVGSFTGAAPSGIVVPNP